MKNLIGGLFETQESANQAYEALQNAGFASEQISMLLRKPSRQTIRSTEVPIQDIAKNAFLGGLIVAAIGALVGFLAGAGILPATIPHQPLLVFAYTLGGAIVGGLIGVILGAARRLLRSPEVAEVMTQQIEKRGVLVTVNVKDPQSESRVRRVMDEHRALEVGNAHEKWDLSAWGNPN